MEYYVDSDYTFNYTEDNSADYTNALVSAYEIMQPTAIWHSR